jgi:ATPases with chaperone activity, ATP-binding subunit
MSNTPYLDFYAKNLNESVKKQLESHAIGRDKEISQLIQILIARKQE